MEYRLTKQDLTNTLRGWSKFTKRKVRLIACGGTAITLLNAKESTKDIDFMVPDKKEFSYLIGILEDIGYKPQSPTRWKKENEIFEIDLYSGNKIFSTELLESPLQKGNHIFLEDVGKIYIGILNSYDLISSKIFMGDMIDYDDCLMLVKAKGKEIDRDVLIEKYTELAKYEIAQDRVMGQLDSFLMRCEKEVNENGK